MTLSFRVPCCPVAQPRPRAVAHGLHARVHEVTHLGKARLGTRRPHPIVAFRASVAHAAAAAHRGAPLEGPIRLSLLLLMPRPKSMLWKKRPMPRAPHVAKPDTENVVKAIQDAITSAGVWRDDSQVAWLVARKLYAAGDELPGVLVEIRQLAMEDAA